MQAGEQMQTCATLTSAIESPVSIEQGYGRDPKIGLDACLKQNSPSLVGNRTTNYGSSSLYLASVPIEKPGLQKL
jgi:hypothetical protein